MVVGGRVWGVMNDFVCIFIIIMLTTSSLSDDTTAQCDKKYVDIGGNDRKHA